MIMKTSMMVIKPKTLHIPSQFCYFIGLHNPLVIDSVQGYLMLVDRVHLVFLVTKHHLLSVFCFTIKQAGLIVIKRKALSNHTLFCAFAALFLHFFVYLSIRIHLALKATNSVMIFPPSSSFRGGSRWWTRGGPGNLSPSPRLKFNF